MMFQTDHHNQVMELCSCSKDNQFKFFVFPFVPWDQYLPLHLLHASLVVHSHCKTMRQITNKMGTESSGNLLVSVNVQYEHIHHNSIQAIICMSQCLAV